MRVYFKGLALGISLLLVLLLLHDQLRPERSKVDDGTGGHDSKQKKNNGKTSAAKGRNPLGGGKGEGTSAAGRSPKKGAKVLLDREDTDPVSWPDEQAINQQVMHSQAVQVHLSDAPQATLQDLRESDRQQGQQWELQQQRFGIQPRGGHPRPPAKLKDASETWLHDMEFPDWYTDSVKRSRVYGRDRDFVGEGPLYPGPCPDAEKVKEQYKKGNIRRYSYLDTGSFLSNSKNPCWYENQKEAVLMRCLPYFYVAGVCKCGTSDLYRRIRYHPDVMEGALKEYHWWDRLRYGAPMELRIYETSEKNDSPVPFAEYSRLITVNEIEGLKKDLKTKGKSVKICGDGSPAYLWDAKQWTVFKGNEGCTEPRIVAGSFIKNANPESKILLIFRHPTQRLYSRFLSRIPRTPSFKGATSKTFHDFVVKSVAMYKKCFREHSIRECAYNATLYKEAVVHVMEGMYSVFLEDWLRIFSRDQLMILRSEDYLQDVEGHIIKVFSFLNLAPLGEEAMKRVVGHWAINVGGSYDKVGPMLPETIEILNEFYKPFVLRLHQLLGEERFLWKDIAVK